jgi:hypothetical protein
LLSLATTLFITGPHNKPLPLLWLIEAGSSSLGWKISEEAKTHTPAVLTHASEKG